LLGIVTVGGLIFQGLNELNSESQAIDVKEYTSNAALIDAQLNAKLAKGRGEEPINRLDEFMMNIPTILPDKGYYFNTPQGHRAFYYENDSGEPFLLDDNYNLWIWAGADPDNPIDDWLVRTPAGDIYNYYMDPYGKLQQKRLGNEKDMRLTLNSSLGRPTDSIKTGSYDFRYRKHSSPSSINQHNLSTDHKITKEKLLDIYLEKQKSNLSKTISKNRYVSYFFNNAENSLNIKDQFRQEQTSFLSSIETDEETLINKG
jgi:hypothetical protein